MATFSETEKYGIERGMPTLRTTSRLAGAEGAQYILAALRLGGRQPRGDVDTIGKNEIRNAVKMAGMVPMPNQMMRMGTTATFGTALKAIITG